MQYAGVRTGLRILAICIALSGCIITPSEIIQIIETIPKLNQNTQQDHNTSDKTIGVTVNNQPYPKSSEPHKPDNEGGEAITIYTGELARYTAWLAYATIVLGIIGACQGFYLRHSVKISEKALTDLETPFLYPIIEHNNIASELQIFSIYNNTADTGEKRTPVIGFKIRNYGRTPALLRSVVAQMVVSTNAPKYLLYTPEYAIDYVIGKDGELSRTIRRAVSNPIDKTTFKKIKGRANHIFLHGEIKFSDLFGYGYIQRFCIAYDYETKSFMPWGESYNKRERQQKEKFSQIIIERLKRIFRPYEAKQPPF